MLKDCKSKGESASHQNFKEKTKNRVDDIQRMFSNLETARKESRPGDVAVLEEQVHQVLREWKVELSQPTPASSLLGGSLGSFSQELARLLQQYDVEDDATSPLKELPPPQLKPEPEPEPEPEPDHDHDLENFEAGNFTAFDLDFFDFKDPQGQSFQGFPELKGSALDFHDTVANDSILASGLEHHRSDLYQDFNEEHIIGADSVSQCGQDALPNILPDISPPPSAFLGPKCAFWDCSRPAHGSKWCQNYCSSCHAVLALSESLPGTAPVLRPGGIGMKDGPMFSALNLKIQGKEVGIPECEGAASTKCPWNAPELFDLSLLEGEKLREWLFFDKPRKAFESGNRKQRGLPDYNGRGWHESRKQIMKEFGGLKRSYYMDPQPLSSREWHLYEYEVNNHSSALYRLELKLADGKKIPKGKVSSDSLADLQKKMGRLSAEATGDDVKSFGGRSDANQNDFIFQPLKL